MSQQITETELLDALAQAAHGCGPDEARTVNEIRAETGLSRGKVMAALLAYRDTGRLVVHRVPRPGIDGRRTFVPAYTIAPIVTKKRVR